MIALAVWNNLLADLQGACASDRESEEEVSKFVGGKENMFVLDVCRRSSQKVPGSGLLGTRDGVYVWTGSVPVSLL